MFKQWKYTNRDGLNKLEKDLKLKSGEVNEIIKKKLIFYF